MLTSRTPLRVSFFGGGTDYPEFYRRFPGAVLGTSIDKYIYISALKLERFIGYNYRLSYRINEEVDKTDQIQHPVFRAAFEHYKLEPGWNFGVLSSLPSQSGLGSSSSFTVGLVRLLSHMRGEGLTRYDLALTAIHIERELMKENVGIQDQLHASFGSLNRYDFTENSFTIRPIRLHSAVRDALNSSMYLVHTGLARYASQTAQEQVQKTVEGKIDKPLSHLYELTRQATAILEKSNPDEILRDLGGMLDEGWKTKRSLSTAVSTPEINELYDVLIRSGASGGKLCGVGGGGFLFVLIPSEARKRVQEAVGDRQLIPIRIDETGATVLTF